MLTLASGAENVYSMELCKMENNSVCLETLLLVIVMGRKAV